MLNSHGETIKGAREYQEDCFEICEEAVENPDGCLVIICDGMGGHQGGALASQLAVTTFVNEFLATKGQSPKEAFQLSLASAHQAIKQEVSEKSAPSEMGTTLLAVYVSGNDVHWISVGDSHLYHYRKGRLIKLNQDHSMASVLDELAEVGRISSEEAKADPQRNALRSCLSSDEISLVDVQSQNGLLGRDDKLLLATDGLDTLALADVEKIFDKYKKKSPEVIVSKLLKAVKSANKPNQDNTTAVVVGAKYQSWVSNWFGLRK